MSLIVTGTGTDVGKTIVSAVIAQRYGGTRPLAYWKPIASGATDSRDSHTVRRLVDARITVLEELYCYDPPVSPHWAGRMADNPVCKDHLTNTWRRHTSHSATLLIEGIGGALVPLNDGGYLFADWLAALQLPCVIVASSTLGTLNHTLLTLEALRQRDVPLAGVILNGPPHPENGQAIARFGQVTIIDHLLPLESIAPDCVARAAQRFDEQALLEPYVTHV